ncbi:ABC transporter substrate-binding protein [Acrocarpospora catenulata]|uniref:ABC transporter substrate-binding protein n=1 Tax=Acrocarpospora catenulata TaxID=2836182 RepID=UPI001BDB3175|nr:ABC transporter substrate-binding protein [Acrocarpospora catenulata]
MIFGQVRLSAAALAVIALATACGGGTDDSGTTADGKQTLRVAYQKSAILSLMDWVAQEQGFFSGRGLSVTLMPSASGQAAVATALNGGVDILYGPQSNTVQAASQGECFKYLTSGHSNTVNVIARPDLALPSKKSDAFPGGLADLKGKKIGVPNLGSATDRNTRTVLAAAGLDVTKDVTFVAIGVGSTAVAALEKGSVDALAAFPPDSTNFPAGSYQTVVDLVGHPESSPLRDVIVSHTVTTCDYLDKHPDTVLNYCRAYYDARDWALDPKNLDALSTILAKYLDMSQDAAKGMWTRYGDVWRQHPTLTPELWAAQSKFNPPDQQTVPDYATWVYAPCAAKDPRA